MVADNVRNAIRTGILALREAPEDELVLRESILQMIYDLNEDWGRLVESDPDWAFNLVYDDRNMEQYENEQAYYEPKPVVGILVIVLVVILSAAALLIN
jgi:hypothetical protein